MARAFTPKMLTANDLFDGDVIYMTASGEWSRHLSDVAIFEEEAAANAALSEANQQHDRLIGPYLVDARYSADGTPEATHFREEFRSRGPSNYPHGKQTEA